MPDTLVFSPCPYVPGGADTVVPLPARGFLLALVVSLHVAGAMTLWRVAEPAVPAVPETVVRVGWIAPVAAVPAVSPSSAPPRAVPVHPARPVRVRTETRRVAPVRTHVVRAAEPVQSMPAAANPEPDAPASTDVTATAAPAGIDIAAAVQDVMMQARDEVGGGGGADYVAPDFNANYLANPKPEYPALSKRLREEGVVKLRVFVMADGRAGEVNPYRSSGFERLDRTALESVARWRFRPARRGGKPIADWVVVPVRFYLQN